MEPTNHRQSAQGDETEGIVQELDRLAVNLDQSGTDQILGVV